MTTSPAEQIAELRHQLRIARTAAAESSVALQRHRRDTADGVKYLLDHANLSTEVGQWWSNAIINALPDAAKFGAPILPGWLELFTEITDARADLAREVPLTLSSVLAKLKRRPATDLIKVERRGVAHNPGGHGSYRGYYEDLYVDFHGKTERTVADFRRDLGTALDKTFRGYKGGEFTMHAQTPVWVDEYGNCDGIRVVGVSGRDGLTVILTAKVNDR